MKTEHKAAFLSTVAVLLVAALLASDLEASPAPGRTSGGGGGSRRGSSSGGGWFSGGSKSTSYSNNGWSSKGSPGKKGSTMKTLKKAAVIGAVAYGGYQLGKLSANFHNWGWGRQYGYGFNDWNRWREVDGFLCRTNDDCNWVDPRLYCQDYELDFQPSALWFGGDVARIVGECSCPYGMYFNDRDMRCETQYFSGGALAAVILVPLLCLCCCCGLGFFAFRKCCKSG